MGNIMKKIFAGVVVAFVTVLTLGVAAGAQGTPTMTLDPDEVEEAGEHDIEVSLSGFSADIALFVLPCDYPEGGNPANLDTNSCDQANLMPVQMDGNGEGTVTVTYDIPEPGIAIIAGDAARTESAFGFLAVVPPVELAATGASSTLVIALFGFGIISLGMGAVYASRRTRLA